MDRRGGTLIADHGRGRLSDRHSACTGRDVTEQVAPGAGPGRAVWIVEDEPASAALAAELCEGRGAEVSLFRAPLPFLAALRESDPADGRRARLAPRARAERRAVPRDSPSVSDTAGDLLDRAHRGRAAVDDHRGCPDDHRREGRWDGAVRARAGLGQRARGRGRACARRGRTRGRRSSLRSRTSSSPRHRRACDGHR